jgi:hypothetical protein
LAENPKPFQFLETIQFGHGLVSQVTQLVKLLYRLIALKGLSLAVEPPLSLLFKKRLV